MCTLDRFSNVDHFSTLDRFHNEDYLRNRSSNGFILTLNKTESGDEEILLNPDRINSIRQRLNEVKLEVIEGKARKGSVLITTGVDEVFCNGFHYRYATAEAKGSDKAYKAHYDEMIDSFKHVVADLISLPMPTIAAINGIATQAGLMLALSHDYLTMKEGTSTRSLVSKLMAIQMTLPAYFAALIRSKVGSPLACRDLVLGDLSFDETGAREKLVLLDEKYDVGIDAKKVATDDLAVFLKQSQQKVKGWKGEVYAEMRKALYPELCKELGLTCTTILPDL